jgi:hypothetical protein
VRAICAVAEGHRVDWIAVRETRRGCLRSEGVDIERLAFDVDRPLRWATAASDRKRPLRFVFVT